MSDIKPVTASPTEGSPAEEAMDRTEQLKARWKTKKPATGKKATSAHLNPKPATHKPNDTSNK
jgi:hypothetical protein